MFTADAFRTKISLMVLSYNMKLKEEPFVLLDSYTKKIPQFDLVKGQTCLETAKSAFATSLGFEARTHDLERGWVTIKFLGIVDKEDSLNLIYGCILPEICVAEFDNFDWVKISKVEDEALTVGVQSI